MNNTNRIVNDSSVVAPNLETTSTRQEPSTLYQEQEVDGLNVSAGEDVL